MNIMNVLRDSIETSISLKLFRTKKESYDRHVKYSKYVKIPISKFKNQSVDNFNSDRLQKTAALAYPLKNRPRGKKDIDSVKFYIKKIENNLNIEPIFIYKRGGKYTLLDGAHRIVAHYICNKKYVPAFIIEA